MPSVVLIRQEHITVSVLVVTNFMLMADIVQVYAFTIDQFMLLCRSMVKVRNLDEDLWVC